MDEKTYYREWYEANGEGLNERRRERYASDPKYREDVETRNASARRKKRQRTLEEKRARQAAKKMQANTTWKTITRVEQIGGAEVEVTYFTIGALAKILGKAISTLRVWEKNGVLPATPHRSGKGDRLYTLEQVTEIRKWLRRKGIIEPATAVSTKAQTLDPITRNVRYADGEIRATKLYFVGTLAAILDKTVVWVKTLEKKGRIPETPLKKSAIGHRLYTAEMLEVVSAAFEKYGLHVRGNDLVWQQLTDHILDGWEALGVLNAEILEDGDEDQGSPSGDQDAGGRT